MGDDADQQWFTGTVTDVHTEEYGRYQGVTIFRVRYDADRECHWSPLNTMVCGEIGDAAAQWSLLGLREATGRGKVRSSWKVRSPTNGLENKLPANEILDSQALSALTYTELQAVAEERGVSSEVIRLAYDEMDLMEAIVGIRHGDALEAGGSVVHRDAAGPPKEADEYETTSASKDGKHEVSTGSLEPTVTEAHPTRGARTHAAVSRVSSGPLRASLRHRSTHRQVVIKLATPDLSCMHAFQDRSIRNARVHFMPEPVHIPP